MKADKVQMACRWLVWFRVFIKQDYMGELGQIRGDFDNLVKLSTARNGNKAYPGIL